MHKRALLIAALLIGLDASSTCQASLQNYPEQDIQVISDYDDTLKIANIAGSHSDIIRRSLMTDGMYAGASKLLRVFHKGMAKNETNLSVVSASPVQLHGMISDDLEDNDFPIVRLFLRDWFKQKDTIQYKLGVIRESVAGGNNFILMGDDTEHDSAIYEQIQSETPEKVKAVYIRRVTGKKIAPNQYSFLTSFDVAVQEHLLGRMSLEDALSVAKSIRWTFWNSRILPKFINCSLAQSACLNSLTASADAKLLKACRAIQERIDNICRKRLD